MTSTVLVLHTGGTIGMVDTPDGAAPVAGALGPYLDWIVESSRGELPPISFLELDRPIDSANATPEDWCTIARILHERRDDHSGFVVLHGTDTMAYTSSALSFLLPSFGKPVVVTGSQIPIARIRSDGRQNLIGALQVAARPDVPEVTLLFGEVLLRGNRAMKIDASGLDAFDSPRFPPLARIGIDIEVNDALVRPRAGEPTLTAGQLGDVAAMRLFPGFSASTLANLCRPPLQGLVLEAYGAGNGPSDDRDFLAAVEAATARGVVVVIVTQCVRGSVQPGAYATGSALIRAGAVPGYDMTSEAALTKLAVLLGRGLDTETVTQMMQLDLAGELTA
ncbi:cytoplasmic asparaginase I [Intrasporangium oryzae NRRL B-24470]|uniref:asparaginase n=1 Tax=Intrasporangium oryzae NRRL B-24470 TaxID=1386089 RepID=W9G9W1_9MICO|nr:type I asparaginase [Intrasporangium oryzae]EWT00654.1 cytoplasmic asparaginase I [Intrasporangium oryzae NRRL B-24470]